MIEGLVLIALGVGLLITARPFARDAGAANRKLLGERSGGRQTSANVAVGVVLGVVAIVAGVVWVVSAVV